MSDLTIIWAELSRLKTKMDHFRPLSKQQTAQLDKEIRYEHIWSSNAIEGSTLNRYETISILETGMTVNQQPIKYAMEAIDLNVAYDYMLDLASKKQPLNQRVIRELNRLATAKTAKNFEDAGVYRATNAWPTGLENQPYVEPFDIRPRMDDLIEWSNQVYDKIHPVQYAADLHQKFVSIHPFADGNGRTARLLMNLALTQNGFPVVNIQPDKASRDQYMNVLANSRTTQNLQPFEELIAGYVKDTLTSRIKILELNEQNQRDAHNDLEP